MKGLTAAAAMAAVLISGSAAYSAVIPWVNGQAAQTEAKEFARALQLNTTSSYVNNGLARPREYVDETLSTMNNSEHIVVPTDRAFVRFERDDDQCVQVDVPQSIEPELLAPALKPYPCEGTTLAPAPSEQDIEALLDSDITELPEVEPGVYCARFEVQADGTIPEVGPEDIQAC